VSGTLDSGWPISTYAGGLSSGSLLPLQKFIGWLLKEPSLALVIPSEVTIVDSEPPLNRFVVGLHWEFVLSENDEPPVRLRTSNGETCEGYPPESDELFGPALIGPWVCKELPGCPANGGCKIGGGGGGIGNWSDGWFCQCDGGRSCEGYPLDDVSLVVGRRPPKECGSCIGYRPDSGGPGGRGGAVNRSDV
jgi:hypothetical protein